MSAERPLRLAGEESTEELSSSALERLDALAAAISGARDSRHAQRLALGAAAVLSESAAIDLLPLARPEAQAWLRDQGLVRHLRGRRVVVWGDVLEALRNPVVPAPGASKPKPRSSSLPRVKL